MQKQQQQQQQQRHVQRGVCAMPNGSQSRGSNSVVLWQERIAATTLTATAIVTATAASALES